MEAFDESGPSLVFRVANIVGEMNLQRITDYVRNLAKQEKTEEDVPRRPTHLN